VIPAALAVREILWNSTLVLEYTVEAS